MQIVGPRLWKKTTLFLKDKRFFHFGTHKNTSFMQKRNMNTVDLSSSSVSSPTDGGDVELHVLGCATSTFTQLWNSGLYPWWWWWCRASCPRISADIIIRDKLWPMPKHGSMLLYVHRNRKAHNDGKPRTAASPFTQLLNSENGRWALGRQQSSLDSPTGCLVQIPL